MTGPCYICGCKDAVRAKSFPCVRWDIDCPMKDSGLAERQKIRERDLKYLSLAMTHACLFSKDPSTKVGAVLVNKDKSFEALGYNGFPRGTDDSAELYSDREKKYARVVHAEVNAIAKAGPEARGGTMYVWPLFSCNNCAGLIINSGVKRVVTPKPLEERWQSAYSVSLEMYKEAGVEVVFFDLWEISAFWRDKQIDWMQFKNVIPGG